MNTFFHKLKLIIEDSYLHNSILFTLGILVLFRALAAIPIPGVDTVKLAQFISGNDFLGVLNIFSGGGLSTLSIIMLGVSPYITSSIIMQLLTVMFPRMKELYQEEGEAGRRKFAQYSRLLSVPLAFIQGFAFIKLLQSQGIIGVLSPIELITNLVVIAAGSILLMWLGELISEFGTGNGVSLLIFAGIVSVLPTQAANLFDTFDSTMLPAYLGFAVVSLAVIYAVTVVTEAERPIPVTYAKQVRGNRVYGGASTYLPIRVNQAGVMPIIFALSILLFPQMIAKFLATASNIWIQKIAAGILFIIENQLVYGIVYFLLVFIFTYFYIAITFDPEQISKNLQRGGAFIPGVRPGQPTAAHLSKIIVRLTLVGALFLGAIAVLPLIVEAATGLAAVAIGGTSLLIVVSVVLDLVRKIDSQISAREY